MFFWVGKLKSSKRSFACVCPSSRDKPNVLQAPGLSIFPTLGFLPSQPPSHRLANWDSNYFRKPRRRPNTRNQPQRQQYLCNRVRRRQTTFPLRRQQSHILHRPPTHHLSSSRTKQNKNSTYETPIFTPLSPLPNHLYLLLVSSPK